MNTTKLLAIGFVIYLVLSLIWMLSLKIKIFKSHGRAVSNKEIKDLVNSGDPMAKKLQRRQNIVILIGVVVVIFLVISNHFN